MLVILWYSKLGCVTLEFIRPAHPGSWIFIESIVAFILGVSIDSSIYKGQGNLEEGGFKGNEKHNLFFTVGSAVKNKEDDGKYYKEKIRFI